MKPWGLPIYSFILPISNHVMYMWAFYPLCCLTNSIFQHTHYGTWTPQHSFWRRKWMQQFHLKVTSRYYNRNKTSFTLLSIFMSVSLVYRHFSSADCESQTRGYSLCLCVMHLQEKICIICVGKLHLWDYWGSCTGRNLKGLHVIDQWVPASYEPSLFVANFLHREQPHYFQAHVFERQENTCTHA